MECQFVSWTVSEEESKSIIVKEKQKEIIRSLITQRKTIQGRPDEAIRKVKSGTKKYATDEGDPTRVTS